MELNDLVKTRSIRSVLGVGKNVRWMVCPLPGHRHSAEPTPSFSIFIGDDGYERFRCHGNCGAMGDVVDLVGFMNFPGYNRREGKNVIEAANLLQNRHRFEVILPVSQDSMPTLGVNSWRKYLPPNDQTIQYAKSRGITIESLLKFKIGTYMHFMTMPTFEDGVLKGIKYRNTMAEFPDYFTRWERLRFAAETGSKKSVFNIDAVAYKTDPFLIVKGEIPVMLLDQLGILACAPNAGEGAKAARWFPKLMLSNKRVLVGDNDAVEKAEIRAAELVAELKFPPKQYKDIDEFILAEPEAVEIVKGWLR